MEPEPKDKPTAQEVFSKALHEFGVDSYDRAFGLGAYADDPPTWRQRIVERYENVMSRLTDIFGPRDEAATLHESPAMKAWMEGKADSLTGERVEKGNVIDWAQHRPDGSGETRRDVVEVLVMERQERLTIRGYVTDDLSAAVRSLDTGEIRVMNYPDFFDVKVLAPSLDAYQQQRQHEIAEWVKANPSLLERPEWTEQPHQAVVPDAPSIQMYGVAYTGARVTVEVADQVKALQHDVRYLAAMDYRGDPSTVVQYKEQLQAHYFQEGTVAAAHGPLVENPYRNWSTSWQSEAWAAGHSHAASQVDRHETSQARSSNSQPERTQQQDNSILRAYTISR